jgi:hypothetical protein
VEDCSTAGRVAVPCDVAGGSPDTRVSVNGNAVFAGAAVADALLEDAITADAVSEATVILYLVMDLAALETTTMLPGAVAGMGTPLSVGALRKPRSGLRSGLLSRGATSGGGLPLLWRRPTDGEIEVRLLAGVGSIDLFDIVIVPFAARIGLHYRTNDWPRSEASVTSIG